MVEEFAAYVQRRFRGVRGFSVSNIWRMRQFYEVYKGKSILAALSRELAWTSDLTCEPR